MAKYKKRADGRYQAKILIGIDEVSGKQKFEVVYAKSIRELEDKKAELKELVNKGIHTNDKKLTLAEWSHAWYKTHKATSGIKTKEMYERLVYTIINPKIGHIRLKELTRTDIQLLINERHEQPRTCQQLKMCLNQIIEAAIEDGLLYKNVCRHISLPSQQREEKRGLTDIEKVAISKADFTDKEKAFIYLIQYCGIRRGEALALTKNDIEFKDNVVKIYKAVTFENNTPILKPMPKSIAGIRNIPMPLILSELMQKYIKSTETIYLFEMERKGGLMSKSSYNKFWNKIVDKINKTAGGTDTIKVIHNLGAHVFRHNYATLIFYAGVDIKDAQYLLGHTDVRLTLNIYTHLDRQKNTAADKINQFLAQ